MKVDCSLETRYEIIDARSENDGVFVFNTIEIPYRKIDFIACCYDKNYCLTFRVIEGKNEVELNKFMASDFMIDCHIEIPGNVKGFLVTKISDNAFVESIGFVCDEDFDIKIPSSVKVIGSYAFAYCPLKKIYIPDSVREIEAYAFSHTKIEEIYIPSSVEQIDGTTFYNSDNIKSIIVDHNNPVYDSRENCNAIIDTAHNALVVGCASTVIPDTVTEIWNCALLNIKNVFIPASVSNISKLLPFCCENIASINVDENNQVYDSRDNCNAIIETSSNKLVLASNRTEIPDSVTEIGFSSFFAADMEMLYIPASVFKIDETAFYNSDNIKSINVAANNPIYDSRDNCNAIIETSTNKLLLGCCNTVIPDTVHAIGRNAFRFRTGIEKIEIPVSVKEIGQEAFGDCKDLKEIVLHDSEIDTHSTSFSYVSKFNVRLKQEADEFLFKFDAGYLCLIGYKASEGFNKPSKLNIPDKVANIMVTSIGDKVFLSNNNLSEIIIPETVKSIGKYAFSNCKSLKNIVIPSSVMEIDATAFAHNNLQTIKVDEDNLVYETSENDTRIVLKVYPSDFVNSIDDTANHFTKNIWGKEKKSVVICEGVPNDTAGYYDEFSYMEKNFIRTSNNYFTHKLDVKSDYREVLLKSLKLWDDVKTLEHLKYIHIYDNNSDINIYIDFTQKIITDNKNKLGANANNIVFEDKSLTELTEGLLSYRGDLVEYSTSPYNILLNPYDNKIVYKNDGGYAYSSLMEEYIGRLTRVLMFENCDLKDYTGICKELLDNMDSCITNCFYIESMSSRMHSKSYKLYATIAIDSTCVENKESIVSFVAEFKKFLDNVYIQIVNNNRLISALENAISHVFNRNLAHNYNSHLFSNLNDIDVYARMNDEAIKANLRNFSGDDDKVFEKGKNMQLHYFFQYLGSRMDYINEITGSMFSEKMVYGDLFMGLDRVRILLNYISGISGFKYKFDVRYNGKPLSDEYDIAVDMPSDTLGMQAFYNIIENIIRNTAKHSINKNNETTISINFRDMEKYPDYYCVEIDNGIQENSVTELVSKLNTYINGAILDVNYKLRQKNLGLIEMEVGALFLRRLDIVDIASKEYKFTSNDDYENKVGNLIIFKAINKEGALGYRFFIRKPKKVLLVGDWDFDENKISLLANWGVQIIGEEAFRHDIKECSVFTHQFVVYKDNAGGDTREIMSNESSCRTLLPLRKIMIPAKDNTIKNIIGDSDGVNVINSLSNYLWFEYYKDKIDIDKVHIGTSFDKKNADNYISQIVFLSHSRKEQLDKNVEGTHNSGGGNVYFEHLSSYTQKKLPDFSCLSQSVEHNALVGYLNGIKNKDYAFVKYAIFEAYESKVIVLDERIQAYSLNNVEGTGDDPIPCSDLFKSTNVLIPESQLDPNEFDEAAVEKIEEFVRDNIKDSFILIHYGIMERMYRNEEIINEKLNEWSRNSHKVVVTSGRGSHSLQLPESVCFVNLSSIQSVFTEHRNKYQINFLINQSRRKI